MLSMITSSMDPAVYVTSFKSFFSFVITIMVAFVCLFLDVSSWPWLWSSFL